MKILFFSESYGKTTFIRNQVYQVAEQNEVLYICNSNYGADEDVIEVQEIPLKFSWLYEKIRRRLEIHQILLTFYNKRFCQQVNQIVTEYQPDIIHLQFGYEAVRFIDNVDTLPIPIIIHFRGYDASRLLRNKAYIRRLKKIMRQPNIYAVSVANHLVSNLRNAGVVFSNTPKVIYSNTDVAFFNRKTVPEKSIFTLIQVSSFREKKGHYFTLKSLHRYITESGDKKIRLILTGAREGHNYFQTLKLVENLQLGEYVDFVGSLSSSEIRDHLEKSHCAVLHSVTAPDGDQEGIPNALMEAMSMQLPVISTNHSGIPELLTEDTFSLLVEEKDIAEYANAIKFMKKNFRLAPENRARIEKYFSTKSFIETLTDFYLTLVSY